MTTLKTPLPMSKRIIDGAAVLLATALCLTVLWLSANATIALFNGQWYWPIRTDTGPLHNYWTGEFDVPVLLIRLTIAAQAFILVPLAWMIAGKAAITDRARSALSGDPLS